MIVVSDTSPITNLAAIGELDLLRQLFGSVVVPSAVAQELLAHGDSAPGAVDVHSLDWCTVRDCADRAMVASLSLDLDVGEAETIALAHEMECHLVLIDERRGRRVAKRLGLTPLGLLGVLVGAKRAGLISAVKPILDELTTSAGFWIGTELYTRVLSEVSEA